MRSRWLVVLAGALLVTSSGVPAADRAGSAGHRAARDSRAQEASLVVTDPGTLSVVRIYTRSDGFTTKIAWQRREPTGWGAAHDLTFGLGVDRDPAVAVTSAGAWLFWRDDRGTVFSAPLELAAGRLLGVPSPLTTLGGLAAGRPGLEGGTDGPITYGNCDPGDASCLPRKLGGTGGVTNPMPGSPPIMEGGTDAPIAHGATTSGGQNLQASSNPGCDRTIVSIAHGDGLLLLEVDATGRVKSRRTTNIQRGITRLEAGTVVGQYVLKTACGE